MRRAAKVDHNQRAVVAALEAAGCTVQSLAAVGDGCPDLLWGRAGRCGLIEVKNPAQPKSSRKLRQSQIDWRDWWRGPPPVVVESVDQALALLGIEVIEK